MANNRIEFNLAEGQRARGEPSRKGAKRFRLALIASAGSKERKDSLAALRVA